MRKMKDQREAPNRRSGGSVAITARLAGRQLRIEVTDDGVGLPVNWRIENISGLGLRVPRERLEALYPPMGERFMIRRRGGGGTELIIQIPMQRTGTEVDGSQL